ncbi:MAG: hypothetical protein KDK34_21315, partial [Leptospiraceae bacterium]|nr:hypothetical protein [Leptospiraceae bacterium]
GAICFAFSDSLIALNRWHAPIPAASYLIMTTYWIALIFITASTRPAWRARTATGDAGM